MCAQYCVLPQRAVHHRVTAADIVSCCCCWCACNAPPVPWEYLVRAATVHQLLVVLFPQRR